jgi:hypothetical protein
MCEDLAHARVGARTPKNHRTFPNLQKDPRVESLNMPVTIFLTDCTRNSSEMRKYEPRMKMGIGDIGLVSRVKGNEMFHPLLRLYREAA